MCDDVSFVHVGIYHCVCSVDGSKCCGFFFFQAEDGIRDLVRSRGLGDVYKRQGPSRETGSRRRRASAATAGLRTGVRSYRPGVRRLSLIHI